MPPRLRRALLVRGAVAWVFARLMAATTIAFAQSFGGRSLSSGIGQPDPRGVQTATWVVLFAAALLWLDIGRRRESTLLRNLGVGVRMSILAAVAPAVLVEGLWLLLG